MQSKSLGRKASLFVTDTSKFRCTICNEVLRDPLQTPCQHTFCKLCIENHLKGAKKCPKCDKDVKKKDLSPASDSLLEQMKELTTYCDNKEQGCDFNGKWGDLPNHLNTCPFQKEACGLADCQELIFRKDRATHTAECENVKTLCSFRQYGCLMKFKRKFYENHMKNNVSEHLLMMSTEHKANTQKLENRIEELQKALDQKTDELKKISKEKSAPAPAPEVSDGWPTFKFKFEKLWDSLQGNQPVRSSDFTAWTTWSLEFRKKDQGVGFFLYCWNGTVSVRLQVKILAKGELLFEYNGPSLIQYKEGEPVGWDSIFDIEKIKNLESVEVKLKFAEIENGNSSLTKGWPVLQFSFANVLESLTKDQQLASPTFMNVSPWILILKKEGDKVKMHLHQLTGETVVRARVQLLVVNESNVPILRYFGTKLQEYKGATSREIGEVPESKLAGTITVHLQFLEIQHASPSSLSAEFFPPFVQDTKDGSFPAIHFQFMNLHETLAKSLFEFSTEFSAGVLWRCKFQQENGKVGFYLQPDFVLPVPEKPKFPVNKNQPPQTKRVIRARCKIQILSKSFVFKRYEKKLDEYEFGKASGWPEITTLDKIKEASPEGIDVYLKFLEVIVVQ